MLNKTIFYKKKKTWIIIINLKLIKNKRIKQIVAAYIHNIHKNLTKYVT